ncbi:proteophosphoglycan 5 [Rhizoctonia solani]|uniref:Proteophosphoglycan 5 n=1 Tax=Rhizoctonia solani TaxID=456999 RepID=A0A8H8T0E7_9AGAM|nr:proteophosphoglycan 5 [Rhizoctonia solani]QRW25316.1 proteophosphoglycan 5 [Rhizoctonia solani]
MRLSPRAFVAEYYTFISSEQQPQCSEDRSAELRTSDKKGGGLSTRTKVKPHSRDGHTYKSPVDDSDSMTRLKASLYANDPSDAGLEVLHLWSSSPRLEWRARRTVGRAFQSRAGHCFQMREACEAVRGRKAFQPDSNDQESSADPIRHEHLGAEWQPKPKRECQSFKPTHELKRLFSPAANQADSQPGTSASLTNFQSQLTDDEQKERHLSAEWQPKPKQECQSFKPTHELKRLFSPAANQADSQPGTSASLTNSQSQLTDDEQKELERHIALGDKPGEVVDENGDRVNTDNLEPAPAMAAAHVDRSAHNEIGQRESSSKEGTASSSGTARSWKSWQRFLRF